MRLNNFPASVNIVTKIFQTTCREAGMITRVQLLEGPPQKFPRAKKRPNFGAISDNFRLWSRISPELIDISNIWLKLQQPLPLPCWAKEIGELRSTNKKVLLAHSDQPKWSFFWRLHFGHYAVLPSQIFTLVTDWPRLPSPFPKGDGGPPQKFNCENLKFGL